MEILEENTTENEKELSEGYFLRSKRRKLDNNKEEVTNAQSLPTNRRRKCPILHLPTEILQKIITYLTYQELSNSVRLVNHRFRLIAEDALNLGFKKLEAKMKALSKSTFEAIQSTEDDVEVKCLCRMLNMLEIVHFQQTVITSTIWRYVYNNRYHNYKSCMYAGTLLDTYVEFLWKFIHIPNQLYSVAVIRDYAMPSEVTTIIQMTKSFCLHFEKVNEEAANNTLFVSGCKLLDLLDNASFAQREVIYEKIADDTFSARYNYFFSNSWFVALNIKSDKQMPWRQKQRMMHMRIRRILLAHTEMFMQQFQYEREMMLRTNPFVRIKKPSNNVYTGYGDIQDNFFYYGVMNDGAYLQKFHSEEQPAEEDPDGEELAPADEELEQVVAAIEANSPEDPSIVRTPHLGIHIDVRLKCPLTHAPVKYLEENCVEETYGKYSCYEGPSLGEAKFNLRMEFQCYGAQYPRLPTTYLYNFKHRM